MKTKLGWVIRFAGLVAVGSGALAGCASGGEKKTTPAAKAENAPKPEDAPASKEFRTLAHEYGLFLLRESPERATAQGIHDYDDKLTDLTPGAFDRRAAQLNSFLARALQLDPAALSKDDAVSLDVLVLELKDRTRAHDLGIHRWGLLSPTTGPQAGGFVELVSSHHPRTTQKDMANLLARYNAFGPWMDDYISLLKTGLEAQETAPRMAVERVLDQLKQLTGQPVERTVFFDARVPDLLPDPDKQKLTQDLQAAARDVVLPAFARLQAFLESAYLPQARAVAGLGGLPNGEALYAYFIQHHTTRELTADQVHEMGVAELERTEALMKAIAVAQKFKRGKVSEFTRKLLKDKKNLAQDRTSLLAAYKDALQRARQKTAEALESAPALEIDIAEMEAGATPGAVAYVQPPDPSRSRNARLMVNTADADSQALFLVDAAVFRQAVPGRYLRWAAGKDRDAPAFRKARLDDAQADAWAVYSEHMADGLDLYPTPLHRYGHLLARALDAARLVVDTGIHAKGWDRAKAADFLREHTALSDAVLDSEVDRITLEPGRSLSALVGALEIESLRSSAQERLGEDFGLKGFHASVLATGAVPLEMLATAVEGWATREKATADARSAALQKAAEQAARAEKQAQEAAEQKAREELQKAAEEKERAEQAAKDAELRAAEKKAEAEHKAKEQQEARVAAELKARQDAERKAKEEEEKRVAAEKKAKQDAEHNAKQEEEEKRVAAEMKAKQDAERKAKEEEEKRVAAEKKAKQDAEPGPAAAAVVVLPTEDAPPPRRAKRRPRPSREETEASEDEDGFFEDDPDAVQSSSLDDLSIKERYFPLWFPDDLHPELEDSKWSLLFGAMLVPGAIFWAPHFLVSSHPDVPFNELVKNTIIRIVIQVGGIMAIMAGQVVLGICCPPGVGFYIWLLPAYAAMSVWSMVSIWQTYLSALVVWNAAIKDQKLRAKPGTHNRKRPKRSGAQSLQDTQPQEPANTPS